MDNTTTESFHKITTTQRVLFENSSREHGPTVIIVGGIHGNEPAGVYALERVIQQIKNDNIQFKGSFHAVAGNLNALHKNIRFETMDLNRIWTKDHLALINDSNVDLNVDEKEQLDLYQIVKEILVSEKGPFYFIDLHTTSASTTPFITLSDSLNNRKFAKNFSLPIILGIEEYLDGPFLTYINEFGHISMGYEAGQHINNESIANCEAFIWSCLEVTGLIDKEHIQGLDNYRETISMHNERKHFFEIDYRYHLQDDEDFMMINGFKNFDHIKKNNVLALSHNIEIKSPINGQIFMPLYQDQGKDGFFIITKISSFWLGLSRIVRKLQLHHLLRLLPGIKQDPKDKYTLIVNPKTAKFLAKEIFHLFGYRKKMMNGSKLYFIRRDREIRNFT